MGGGGQNCLFESTVWDTWYCLTGWREFLGINFTVRNDTRLYSSGMDNDGAVEIIRRRFLFFFFCGFGSKGTIFNAETVVR